MKGDEIAAVGFLSLIAQTAINLKEGGLLTPDTIDEMEKRASIQLKNATFHSDIDEQSQLNIIERALSYLGEGAEQLRSVLAGD
jgi:hypothetical protein